MGKSITGPAKCKVCGSNHWDRDPHIWKDEPEPKKIVATLKKKVATITDTPKNVATIRQVSIRQLNSNISKHFSNLPFEVTKNGKVIARVERV